MDISITYVTIRFISLIKVDEPPSLPVKAAATFPITRDIIGRIAPAKIAENNPANSKNLSLLSQKEKNFNKLTFLTSYSPLFCCSGS
jgi:hypothetical protein